MITRKMNTSAKRIALASFCALGLTAGTTAYGQIGDIGEATNPIQDRLRPGTGDEPLQRGAREAVRGALQGDSVGQSVQRGLGEAAQSAVETPQQQLQRDRFNARQDGRFGANGQGTMYRDPQGRSFYLDNQGRQVYMQPQVTGQPQVRGNQPGNWSQSSPQQGLYESGQAIHLNQQMSQNAQNRARLGVSIEAADQGVRVIGVQTQSAAQQAGLQPGDVIKSVNGESVNDPATLSQRIQDFDSNEPLEIVVMRGEEEKSMKANLAANSSNNDTYRAAKPANDSATNQMLDQMQQELTELRREVESLKQQLGNGEANNGNAANNGGAAAGASATDLPTDIDTNTDIQTEADIDTGTGLDSDTGVDTATDLEVDGDAGLGTGNLGTGLGSDAGAGLGVGDSQN